jgi:hypothetical protein
MTTALAQLDPNALASLLDKYGIPIVAIAMLSIVVVALFKLYKDAVTASNKAAIDVLQQALDSEKAARKSAESRLESNSTALKEATIDFAAALAVMEKLAERDERPHAPRR